MKLLLGIVVVSWIVSLAAACAGLAFCCGDSPSRRRLALPVAALALIIGYLGFGHWSPFRFFPQVSYMWSSGETRIYIASSWFFLAPLILGGLTLALLLRRYVQNKEKV